MSFEKRSFDKHLPLMKSLGLRDEAVASVRAYVDLLWKSNEELNLISRKMTFDELIENHVVDCLLPLPQFPVGIKCAADLGAGGGLPGVIYAIQFPDIEYRLYEKSPLKREFLGRCQALAPNLEIVAEITTDLKGVELVTARAFKPIDVILDMTRKYFESGGSYFLLKGRAEKIEEERADATKKFKNLKLEIQPLKSPILEVERHLVLINAKA